MIHHPAWVAFTGYLCALLVKPSKYRPHTPCYLPTQAISFVLSRMPFNELLNFRKSGEFAGPGRARG